MLNWAKDYCEIMTHSVINLTVHFTGKKIHLVSWVLILDL